LKEEEKGLGVGKERSREKLKKSGYTFKEALTCTRKGKSVIVFWC
jgi:hypothetical protein